MFLTLFGVWLVIKMIQTRQDKTRQDLNLLACFLNSTVIQSVNALTIKNSLKRVS